MAEFNITIQSFQQIQALVNLAMEQSFDVMVGNQWQQINGKDLMGMCSLDYTRPVRVSVRCEESAYERFRQEAEKIVRENMAVE